MIKGRKDVYVPELSLPDYLYPKIQERGDAIAMIDNDSSGKSITFREIYDRSRGCAAFLHEQGLTRGDFVGLIAPSTIDFPVAMLGILASGATVVPCNPDFGEGELLQLLTTSEPRMIIVHGDHLQPVRSIQRKLTCLEKVFVIGKSCEFKTLETTLASESDLNFLSNVNINPEEDVAIVAFSSGTTGLPKSVIRTHMNLVSSIASALLTGRFNKDTYINYMDRPLYHAGGYGIMLTALGMGVKFLFEKTLEINRTMMTIQRYQVTQLTTSPSVLIQLAHSEQALQSDVPSLKILACLGGSLPPAIIRRLAEKLHVYVYRNYGMTEVGSICDVVDMKHSLESIGKPNPLIELKVINQLTGEDCCLDQAGEILIRGPQVTKGYLNNPQATAQAIDSDGWFHTGDMGYIDKNGMVFIVDRLKDVIKYKSFQVSPAELEKVILNHSKVLDVGVIGIPDSINGEVPKAFVVREDVSLTEAEVQRLVNDQLAEYKHLGGGVQFVDSIPKSALGKTLRKELKKLAGLG